jgi:hypothetical protein
VFEAPSLSVEIELTLEGVVGQLVPPVSGEVLVLSTAGEVDRAVADGLGCFTATVPAGRPVRFRCTTAVGAVITDWVRL